jgi:hypothetical protein
MHKVHLFSVDRSVHTPDELITVEHASLIIMNNRDKSFEVHSEKKASTTIQGVENEDTVMSILIRDKDAGVFMVAGGPCADIPGLISCPMGIVAEPMGLDENGDMTSISAEELMTNVANSIPEYVHEANKHALKEEPEDINDLNLALNKMLDYVNEI